ncbi:MAG: hypothetical protein U1F43_12190 [Myxococcota bacterium]
MNSAHAPGRPSSGKAAKKPGTKPSTALMSALAAVAASMAGESVGTGAAARAPAPSASDDSESTAKRETDASFMVVPSAVGPRPFCSSGVTKRVTM